MQKEMVYADHPSHVGKAAKSSLIACMEKQNLTDFKKENHISLRKTQILHLFITLEHF